MPRPASRASAPGAASLAAVSAAADAVAGALLAAALLAAAPAAAQAPPDTAAAVTLPLVDVTATRGQSADAARAAHVVRLTRPDLVGLRASTLADALERTGSASVRRYGPTGLATVSLRGATSAQTAVFLDGVRLSDPVVGGLDLSLVPVAALGGVTTVAGAASAWHGSDAVAGAVLLDARRVRGLDLAVGAASASTVSLDAAAGAGPWSVAVGAETSAGDYAYRDATVFPAADARRQGADLRRASVLVGAHAGATRAGLWVAGADRGLPGALGTPVAAAARQRDALARVWASRGGRWGGRGTAAGGTWRVAAHAHAARLDYRGPGSASQSDPRTVGVEADVAGPLEARVAWRAGVSAARTRVRNDALTGAPVEHGVAAWTSADVRAGRLTLSPALRLDGLAQAGATYRPLSPRLGARLDASPAWALRASAGRAFRAPSLSDRFWQGAGCADLRPERGWTVDVGADGRIAGRVGRDTRPVSRPAGRSAAPSGRLPVTGRVAMTAFARRMTDEIVWRPGPDGVWRPGNVRRTAAYGLDLAADATLGRAALRASAGLVDARDRSGDPATDGRPLPYVPRWTLRGDARTPVARLGQTALGLDLAAQATGRRPTTADASTWLPPHGTVDVGADLARGPLALDVQVTNALGAAYVLVEGYPMPGRGVRARLRLTL